MAVNFATNVMSVIRERPVCRKLYASDGESKYYACRIFQYENGYKNFKALDLTTTPFGTT